jgi:hypothetical protein
MASRAVADPTNPEVAYVTFTGYNVAAGGHIWKTSNLSATPPTWTPISNGIPDVPVNAIVIDPTNSNLLYAGTDIGVYRSSDAGTTWAPFANGLPRVAVFGLAFQAPNNPAFTNRILRAATHGRGIWEMEIVTGCPVIAVNPLTVPSGMAGQPYTQTFTASGGTAPHSFTISAGALPNGLNLASNGELTGTPIAFGTFNFTVRATATGGCMGERGYLLVINPPCPTINISPSTLPDGQTGQTYNQTLTASGGTGPYTFNVTTGTLPAGLTLSSSGTLSGTPTATGSSSFSVTATASTGCTGTGAYTLTINPPPVAL